MTKTTENSVDHPTHYQHAASGVECIDISEEQGHNRGAAFDYVFRFRHKESPLEDCRKAIWYVERWLSNERLAHIDPEMTADLAARVERLSNHEDDHLVAALFCVLTSRNRLMLLAAKRILLHLIDQLETHSDESAGHEPEHVCTCRHSHQSCSGEKPQEPALSAP